MTDRLRDQRDVLDPARLVDVRDALQALIERRHTMHVPPESTDADLVVGQWLADARDTIRDLRGGDS